MKAGQPTFIERYFEIRSSGSTIRTEILAGLTTFLAMSYILFINPSVLAKAGMEWGAVFLATIIASIIGTKVGCMFSFVEVFFSRGGHTEVKINTFITAKRERGFSVHPRAAIPVFLCFFLLGMG